MTSEVLINALLNHNRQYLELARSTGKVDRDEVIDAIYTVYEGTGRSKPQVLFWDSPWQMVQVPKMLENCGLGPFLLDNYVQKIVDRSRATISGHLANSGQYIELRGPTDGERFEMGNNIRGLRLNSILLQFHRLRINPNCSALSQNLLHELRTNPHVVLDPIHEADCDALSKDGDAWRRIARSAPIYESSIEWGRWDILPQILLLDFCRQYFEITFEPDWARQIDAIVCVGRNAHAFLCFDNICFLSDFPEQLSTDHAMRYHSVDGPCLRYEDGLTFHAWHGTFVRESVIVDRPTLQAIELERNVEVRRVMVERYGEEEYLLDSGARKIDESRFGTLYRKDFFDDESLAMVKVINKTAEPDGSYRTYFLRVPPTARTAREGIAWTFGMDARAYDPTAES